MTDPTVPPADDAAKRSAAIADLRAFADFLARNPWAPLPQANLQADLQENADDFWNGGAAGVAELRRIADAMGEKPEEHLTDRTQVKRQFGGLQYQVITWHTAGRPDERDPRDVELERLRAEVAELRAAAVRPPVNLGAFGYSREADDPTPPGAREPLHTGGGQLVDETPAESVRDTDDFRPVEGPTLATVHRRWLDNPSMGSFEGAAKAAGFERLPDGRLGRRQDSDGAVAEVREPQAADTVPVPAEDATLTPLPEPEPQCTPDCDALHVPGAPTGLARGFHHDACPLVPVLEAADRERLAEFEGEVR